MPNLDESFEVLHESLMRECDSLIDPELDGTCIPNVDRWRDFTTIPVTVPLRRETGGFTHMKVVGQLGSSALRFEM